MNSDNTIAPNDMPNEIDRFLIYLNNWGCRSILRSNGFGSKLFSWCLSSSAKVWLQVRCCGMSLWGLGKHFLDKSGKKCIFLSCFTNSSVRSFAQEIKPWRKDITFTVWLTINQGFKLGDCTQNPEPALYANVLLCRWMSRGENSIQSCKLAGGVKEVSLI